MPGDWGYIRDQDLIRKSYDPNLTDAQRHAIDLAHTESILQGKPDSGFRRVEQREGAGAGLFMIAAIAFVVLFVFVASFFPLTGVLMIAGAYLASTALTFFFPGAWGLQQAAVVVPAVLIVFLVAQRIEYRLAAFGVYRVVRHIVRLLAMGAVMLGVIDTFRSGDIMRTPGSFTAAELSGVGVFVVLMHFLGWSYEKWTGAAIAAERAGGDSVSFGAALRSTLPFHSASWMTPALARALIGFALLGGAIGAFLGYSAFDTNTATLLGLSIGGVSGIVLLLVLRVVTWPIRGVMARFPVLWPVLIGLVFGGAITWRGAQVDSVPIGTYALPAIGGSVLALVVPYLLYRGVRAIFRPRRSTAS